MIRDTAARYAQSKLASGELIGCFGLTEPDHGSDAGAITSMMKRNSAGKSLDIARRRQI